jgi:hypothetical protein
MNRIKRVYEADICKFMMDFELKLERPKNSSGWISALVMGISYFLGMSSTSPFSRFTLLALHFRY